MTLEELIRDVEDNYPDIMMQKEFAKAIRMSPAMAYKLNHRGDVPYKEVQEGQKRYYQIKKEDVISWLRKRYGHYSGQHILMEKELLKRRLDAEAPLISVSDIARITGIGKYTVAKWVEQGKLKCFYYKQKHMIRRIDLMDFLASIGQQEYFIHLH